MWTCLLYTSRCVYETARELKARVDKHNRWLRSLGRPEDYTMAHAIHSALYEYFDGLERKESPEAATSRGSR